MDQQNPPSLKQRAIALWYRIERCVRSHVYANALLRDKQREIDALNETVRKVSESNDQTRHNLITLHEALTGKKSPVDPEVLRIITMIQVQQDIDKAYWFGDPQGGAPFGLNGIMSLIEQASENITTEGAGAPDPDKARRGEFDLLYRYSPIPDSTKGGRPKSILGFNEDKYIMGCDPISNPSELPTATKIHFRKDEDGNIQAIPLTDNQIAEFINNQPFKLEE